MLSKPLSPKALLSLSSSSSHLCSSVLVSHFSSSSSPFHHSSSYVESRNVRVSVWWDFENCNVPVGANVHRVAPAIIAAVRSSGIKGPIQITAFGDVLQLSRANQEALSSSGINLTHIPGGGKNSADRSLLVDLMYWVSQNPPPAHLFLISGDKDFASVLHRLRMNNYNILLASTDTAHRVLYSAASIMWNWNALVKGENLTGRHFNQPPDGPYGSWYGHYKVPLEDPFPVIEQPSRSNSSSDSGLEPTTRPIPDRVMQHISNILSLRPKGVSITELRLELANSNAGLDKDLYGYKKFSRFLFSMPHILKLKYSADGQFMVFRNTAKAPEQLELTVTDNGNQYSKSNGEDLCSYGSRDGNLSLLPPPELKGEPSEAVNQPPCPAEKDTEEYVQNSTTKMDQPPPTSETAVKVVNPSTKDHLSPVKEQDSAFEIDILKKIRRLWYGSEIASHIQSNVNPKESFTATDSSEVKSERTPVTCSDGDTSGKKGVKEMKHPGLFERILNWFKLLSNRSNSDAPDSQPGDVLKQDSSLRKLDIFSEDTFWRDIESFIDNKVGSQIISRSSTRKDMAQNLQEEGPLVLRSLDTSNVLQLVDMLISEKKWVKEHPSEAFPFKLTRPARKNMPSGNFQTSNGLTSIFMSTQSQSDLSGLVGDKRKPNISDTEVSPPITDKKPRSEILADCQNLLNEVLKEYPKGYNMATFRKRFHDRYMYHLDIKGLGYQNLASLMQIMPGIKIEGSHIFPSGKISKHSNHGFENCTDCIARESDTELSDASRKDDDSDSSWEELGPVASTGFREKKRLFVSRRKPEKETQNSAHYHYEPAVSDDDFSESDGESLNASRSLGQKNEKQGVNSEDSLFVEVLNSWSPDSTKGGDQKNGKPENEEVMVDCATKAIQRQDSSGQGTKTESSVGNYERKQRRSKNYSFVADPDKDNRDKLLDGIIGSLKKSGESRMQG